MLKLEKISRLHMADLTVYSSIDWDWEQAVLKLDRLYIELILGWYRGAGSAETGEDLTPSHG